VQLGTRCTVNYPVWFRGWPWMDWTRHRKVRHPEMCFCGSGQETRGAVNSSDISQILPRPPRFHVPVVEIIFCYTWLQVLWCDIFFFSLSWIPQTPLHFTQSLLGSTVLWEPCLLYGRCPFSLLFTCFSSFTFWSCLKSFFASSDQLSSGSPTFLLS
jgi:hypothetical protein